MVARIAGGLLVGVALGAAGWWILEDRPAARDRLVDRDRDGLDDRLEDRLAREHFPIIHQFGEAEGLKEECPGPLPRPVLFRLRPRVENNRADDSYAAITYVLLYAEDCGALGHAGDNESFTIVLQRHPASGQWKTLIASAIAHKGTEGEYRSIGSGDAVWVSRNKHATFATFDACGDSDVPVDLCAEDGPPPSAVVFLNVGEPWAPLADDVGDIVPAMSSDETARGPLLKLFGGRTIWKHEAFLDSGDITSLLFINRKTYLLPPGLIWDAEEDAADAAPALEAPTRGPAAQF